LNWIFGIFFLLLGTLTLFSPEPILAISVVGIGLLLLPPFKTFLRSKLPKQLSFEIKGQRYLWLSLNWIFGIFFLLVGLLALLMLEPLPAIPPGVIALLLLPPVRRFVHSRLQIQLPVETRGILIFLLLIVLGILSNLS